MNFPIFIANQGTLSNVASSAADVLILAKNIGRKGGIIFNDSTAVLYLQLGDGTTTTSNYTTQIGSDVYFQIPTNYVGQIRGLWASANGNARVTEFT